MPNSDPSCTHTQAGNGQQRGNGVGAGAGEGMLGESRGLWLRTHPGEAGRWQEVAQHMSQGSTVPSDFTYKTQDQDKIIIIFYSGYGAPLRACPSLHGQEAGLVSF